VSTTAELARLLRGILAAVPSPSPASAPRFLTVKQVAKELAITESITYTLLRSGELPAIQVGPKNVWRIERTKLEEYIADRYAATRRAVESGEVSAGSAAEPED
jgi:excisionase family DNA binding protein